MSGPRGAGQAQDLFGGLREWRATQPTATFAQSEAALARQGAQGRGLMLAARALASAAADLQARGQTVCPDCGGPLQDEGGPARTLLTWGPVPVTLQRA